MNRPVHIAKKNPTTTPTTKPVSHMSANLLLFITLCLLFSDFVLLVIDVSISHVQQLQRINLRNAHIKEVVMLVGRVGLNQLVKQVELSKSIQAFSAYKLAC